MGSVKRTNRAACGGGGGYYGLPINSIAYVPAQYNQGGMWQGSYSDSDTWEWYLDHSGSGGEAGAGGKIYYCDDYTISKLHAYNGNRITEKNFDYTVDFYGYDATGAKLTTGTKYSVVTKQNGEQIIPAFIYAQSGTIRPVYKTNQHMTEAECSKYGCSYISAPNNSTQNVMIFAGNSNNPTTSYGQGIGSGAGNLEKSNGVFLPLSKK